MNTKMKISGIYKIQSKRKPERIYIGSSVNIEARKNKHFHYLKTHTHGNNKLQNHYNKYGISDLEFSLIVGCDADCLIAFEQFYIDSLDPWFNIYRTAYSPFGHKHSPESIEKMKGNKNKKGKKVSDKTIEKIRKANIGKKKSVETRKKMSDSQKRIGNHPPSPIGREPWNKGKAGVRDYTNRKKGRALCHQV